MFEVGVWIKGREQTIGPPGYNLQVLHGLLVDVWNEGLTAINRPSGSLKVLQDRGEFVME